MIVYDIQHLTKIYPGQQKPANKDICLQIQQGEIFGLLGENGAGKSTLVRQMANLVQSTAGSISLYGRPLGQDALHAPRYIGYMTQDGLALNNLTVEEALYFTAHLQGLDRREACRECQALLDLWQIHEIHRRPNTRLSGGQKRLLQLAVAMAGFPPLLLLDEPTNDLDPQRRKEVWDILRRLNQEKGTTIIFITHDAIEAEKIIQRVGILHAGVLVALGRPPELKAQIDRKLRLKLFFTPGAPPCLPAGLVPHPVDAGRWLVYLDREQMFGNLSKVCSNFTFMRASGTLDYFAALPIQRTAVILATVMAFLLLSLPSLAVAVLADALILRVPLAVHPLVVAAVPLAAIPLAGIGALIEASARTPEGADTLSNLLTFFLLGFGPVIIPPERLPGFVVTSGWQSPATYAASALRQVLLGPVTGRLGFDLGVLAALSAILFWLLERKMEWRKK